MEIYMAYVLLWIGVGLTTVVTLLLWVAPRGVETNYVAAGIMTALGPITLLLVLIAFAVDRLNRPKICCSMCGRASDWLSRDVRTVLPACGPCLKKIRKEARR